MIRIGEFSKLVQVPVATLRYYDQLGLLRPIAVDRATGYRFYDASQLPRLHRIRALKSLGFSLEQIGTVLQEDVTPRQLRDMLHLRQTQIRQQFVDLQRHLADIEARLQQIEREAELSPYDVILKQVEPLLVASVRAILPDHSAVASLFPEVYEALGAHVEAALGAHPGHGGQALVLCYDTEFREQGVDKAAAFIVRCAAPDRGRMRVHQLPGATMAATVHHGPYRTIGQAHEAILAWIDLSGYRIVGPDREINLYNTMPISLDDPSYVTEIQYPVEPTNA